MARRSTKTVIDRDLGWKRLGKALRDTSWNAVDVGVPSGSQRRDGGPTNAEVYAWHEYGTGTIPKRSSLRATFDKNFLLYQKIGATLGLQVLLGRIPKRQALQILGLKFANDIKAAIRAGIPPALAESTAAAKRSTTPLIDTGQLIGAIKAVVVRK